MFFNHVVDYYLGEFWIHNPFPHWPKFYHLLGTKDETPKKCIEKRQPAEVRSPLDSTCLPTFFWSREWPHKLQVFMGEMMMNYQIVSGAPIMFSESHVVETYVGDVWLWSWRKDSIGISIGTQSDQLQQIECWNSKAKNKGPYVAVVIDCFWMWRWRLSMQEGPLNQGIAYLAYSASTWNASETCSPRKTAATRTSKLSGPRKHSVAWLQAQVREKGGGYNFNCIGWLAGDVFLDGWKPQTISLLLLDLRCTQLAMIHTCSYLSSIMSTPD